MGIDSVLSPLSTPSTLLTLSALPTTSSISARVAKQYELFPYPNYSLWARLRTQEAYASHSLFAARLASCHGYRPALASQVHPNILAAGCGDTFPYLLTRWEPSHHSLIAVDLSQKNLARARMRAWPLAHRIRWQQGNLEAPDFAWPQRLSHIDAYGVLHHLNRPQRVLQAFGEHLLPSGTLRLMVYNASARTWIRHLQKALSLLHLSPFESADIRIAQALLGRVVVLSSVLRQRLNAMPNALDMPSRLVDTFMHQREAHLDWDFWMDSLQAAGLKPLGLFDRYGELDDLPNPLLRLPTREEMHARLADRRFENNCELWAIKPATTGKPATAQALGMEAHASQNHSQGLPRLQAWRNFISPCKTWFAYRETQNLSWVERRRLVLAFHAHIATSAWDAGSPHAMTSLQKAVQTLPPRAVQRLARLGVLWPLAGLDQEWKDLMLAPMEESMDAPLWDAPSPLQEDAELLKQLHTIIASKGLPKTRVTLVLKRLHAAQNP